MIQANELRIGNYVLVNGHLQEVCEIPLPENCTDKNTKPIELTEEILLKCGFEVSKYSDKLFILGLTEWSSIQVHLYKNKCATELSISKHSQVVEVYFLHQLQNLYLCLCGKELNVNI